MPGYIINVRRLRPLEDIKVELGLRYVILAHTDDRGNFLTVFWSKESAARLRRHPNTIGIDAGPRHKLMGRRGIY